MKIIQHIACTGIILFSPLAVSAQGNPDPGSLIWLEGKNVTRLTLITDEIAEILPPESNVRDSAASIGGGAVVLTAKNRIRIWKISGNPGLTAKMLSGTGGGSYSEVFLDSSGRKRALPGNIVVFMKKGMTEEEVSAWAVKKNLTVIRMISRYSNSYLIKTAPGIESLTLSNSLYGDDSVLVSTPNWWTEVSPR